MDGAAAMTGKNDGTFLNPVEYVSVLTCHALAPIFHTFSHGLRVTWRGNTQLTVIEGVFHK